MQSGVKRVLVSVKCDEKAERHEEAVFDYILSLNLQKSFSKNKVSSSESWTHNTDYQWFSSLMPCWLLTFGCKFESWTPL